MIPYKGYMGKIEFDGDADIFHGKASSGLLDVIIFQPGM
jgi:predicted HicB family RNase H-like nuclease